MSHASEPYSPQRVGGAQEVEIDMASDRARVTDLDLKDSETWVSSPAERYKYALLFALLSGLGAVGLMFWRSRTAAAKMIPKGKSESGRRRMMRQTKQRSAAKRKSSQRDSRFAA